MTSKKKNFKNWVKEHKTKLIIAGVSMSVILMVIIIYMILVIKCLNNMMLNKQEN